jgi:hypothetical protein
MKKYELQVFGRPGEILTSLDEIFLKYPAYAVLIAQQWHEILESLLVLPQDADYCLRIVNSRVLIQPDWICLPCRKLKF